MMKPRGILNPKAGAQKFQISRHSPAPDLSFFIECYWIITWNLQAPYVQETLPYPCVNLVIEKDRSRVYGVVTGKFSRVLEGSGRVFGIKFRPGAFYPFLNAPASTLTNSSRRVEDMFDAALESAILSTEDKALMIGHAEDFLRARMPEQDEHIRLVNQIIDCITDDRTITRVDDLVRRLHIHKRALQRLFNQYVGVSPKWVIQRCRLHEAAEQLEAGNTADGSRLAVELGYFDQAHFIKDFKTIVGQTPAEYARQMAPAVIFSPRQQEYESCR